jgi:dTDP-4-dehydrorhamnose reductase
MNQPAILVLGKNGQVGWELQRTLAPLGQIVARDFPEMDFTRPDDLRRLVLELKPALIVNAAAYTAVDRAETEAELAHKINAIAPGVIAEAARQVDSWLIHFSTDYVFDGTKRTAYVETDTTSPLGVYGQSKLAGDLAVQASGAKHLIFRLCWVYGARGQNFMLTMQRLARERPVLKVVSDQFGAPTWSRAIAEAMAPISHQILGNPAMAEVSGVYHLACGGQTSWHGFAQRIVEMMPETERTAREVLAITTADYPTPARRPAWSVMDCTKLQKTFRIRLPHWEDALRLVSESR